MRCVMVTCRVVDLQFSRAGRQTTTGVMVPTAKATVTLRPAPADAETRIDVLGGTELRLEVIGEAAQVFIDRWYRYVADGSHTAEPPAFVVQVTPADDV